MDPQLAELVESNLDLVRHVVFQVAVHFPRHVDREELARAGALGLVEAARRWDSDRGVPFERFASRRIRGAILDAVRAADWAPRSVRVVARRVEAAEAGLANQLGRRPSSSELAESLGLSGRELARLNARVFRSVVLALEHEVSDAGGEEDLTLVEVLRDASAVDPDEMLEARELLGYVHDAISLLPERQRLVITGYFLEGRTSAELARFLGVTESRISQMRSEALGQLRAGVAAQYGSNAVDAEGSGSRRAQRQARYVDAIAGASDWRDRLDGSAALSSIS